MFNVKLGISDFLKGETVTSNSAIGDVESWDTKLGLLKISSGESFIVNETIRWLTTEGDLLLFFIR